jgi:hypothetical protein
MHLPVPNDIFSQRHLPSFLNAVAVSVGMRSLEAALEGRESGT